MEFYYLTQLNWWPIIHWRNSWNVLHWLHKISRLFLHICYIVGGIVYTLYECEGESIIIRTLWNLSLSISKRKTFFLYTIFLFANTLFPPVKKLFLSVTKFSIYFFPYISFSGLVPIMYVLRLLRVPLHEAPDFQLFWFMLNGCTHVFIYSCLRILY